MSRYEIPALDDKKYQVFMGWDPMLNTFFAQIYDRDEEDEEKSPHLWIGATPPQILDLSELAHLMFPYAVLTSDIRLKLYNDSN